MQVNTIYNENCLTGLSKLDADSIDCCVTSPPYWGLRDYGNEDQIGLEETPEQYVAKMVAVFEEVRRILKPEGTLWLNLGDSYNGYKANAKSHTSGSPFAGFRGQPTRESKFGLESKDCKPKDLIGIPWMVAFALRSAGWYLRQDIIWAKPSCMPESVTDRCTKSHEYIFLLSKSQRYYFDQEAIKEVAISTDKTNRDRDASKLNNTPGRTRMAGLKTNHYEMRNKRSVWSVASEPLADAHFAPYPQKLIIDCIKAGCPENGIVLDPFMGAGTTALVARKLNKNYIGFELNPEYIAIAERRLYKELGMFI